MLRFKVSGMSCGHCAGTVTKAVKGVDQTASVEIDLQAGAVTVHSGADAAKLAEAIDLATRSRSRSPDLAAGGAA